jgi:hypothetical protein
MNFPKLLQQGDPGTGWHEALRAFGNTCAGMDFSDMLSVLPAYAAAVAWDNIRRCNRMDFSHQQRFASIVNRSWANIQNGAPPNSVPTSMLVDIVAFTTLRTMAMHQEYAEHVLSRGNRDRTHFFEPLKS